MRVNVSAAKVKEISAAHYHAITPCGVQCCNPSPQWLWQMLARWGVSWVLWRRWGVGWACLRNWGYLSPFKATERKENSTAHFIEGQLVPCSAVLLPLSDLSVCPVLKQPPLSLTVNNQVRSWTFYPRTWPLGSTLFQRGLIIAMWLPDCKLMEQTSGFIIILFIIIFL